MNDGNDKTTVRLQVSPRIASLVGRDASREVQLQTARGGTELQGRDLVTALLFLCHGPDPDIRATALTTMRNIPSEVLRPILQAPETPEPLIAFIRRLHPGLAPPGPETKVEEAVSSPGKSGAPESADLDQEEQAWDGSADGAEGEEPIEEEEVNASKYQLSLTMGVAERIKMALTGDKEWRTLMIKDANKLVHSAALKNPRITEGEVLLVAKNKSSSDELIRLITANKEWLKSYEIQRALVIHPRTPLPKALRFLGMLGEKDLKKLASSRDVSPILVNTARRLLLAKQKRK